MQHMGAGGDSSPSDAIAADYNADGAPAEDEYNPDVSEISQFDSSRPFISFSAHLLLTYYCSLYCRLMAASCKYAWYRFNELIIIELECNPRYISDCRSHHSFEADAKHNTLIANDT